MASQSDRDHDIRNRLDALQRLLAQHPVVPAIDVTDQSVTAETTLLRSLFDGIPEGRLRALSAEVRSRADVHEIDALDAVVMRFLLDAYRDTVGRVQTAVQISGEKLRRCTADIREAKRLVQRQLAP
jgi:hypothetical protein